MTDSNEQREQLLHMAVALAEHGQVAQALWMIREAMASRNLDGETIDIGPVEVGGIA